MATLRVTFDATIDEVTDVSIRLAKSTGTYRRQRRVSAVACGGSCVAAIVVTNGLLTGWAFNALVIAAGAALPIAIVCAVAYGSYVERYIEGHSRHMYREMYGEAATIHCDMEMRPEVFWCRTNGVEITFPWSRLKRVIDSPDGIELWFDPGLAIVRDRGFTGDADRRRFVEAARGFLAASPDRRSTPQSS